MVAIAFITVLCGSMAGPAINGGSSATGPVLLNPNQMTTQQTAISRQALLLCNDPAWVDAARQEFSVRGDTLDQAASAADALYRLVEPSHRISQLLLEPHAAGSSCAISSASPPGEMGSQVELVLLGNTDGMPGSRTVRPRPHTRRTRPNPPQYGTTATLPRPHPGHFGHRGHVRRPRCRVPLPTHRPPVRPPPRRCRNPRPPAPPRIRHDRPRPVHPSDRTRGPLPPPDRGRCPRRHVRNRPGGPGPPQPVRQHQPPARCADVPRSAPPYRATAADLRHPGRTHPHRTHREPPRQ